MRDDGMDIPRVIRLAVNEHWRQSLPGRGTAGYQWVHELDGDQGTVKVSISATSAPRSLKLGGEPPDAGSRDEHLDIHALKAGTSHLLLTQKRPWEHGKTPLKQYRIKIIVHNS